LDIPGFKGAPAALAALCFALSLAPTVSRAATAQQLIDQCQAELGEVHAWYDRTGEDRGRFDQSVAETAQAVLTVPASQLRDNNAHYQSYVDDQTRAADVAATPTLRDIALNTVWVNRLWICLNNAALAAGSSSAPASRAAPATRSPALPSNNAASSSGGPAPVPPDVVVAGQQAIDELERLANGARDYVQGSEQEGEDAADCVKLLPSPDGYQAAKLIVDEGKCPYRVEVIWCTEGLDCKPTFSNQSTIGPGPDKYVKVSGTSGVNRSAFVRWGACRGANTIHQNGMPTLHYYCTKEH
jgi:hypothetical protein